MDKRFTRVLFVNPAYQGSHYRAPSLLSGLGYVSEALSQAGIENRVVDMALGYTRSDLIRIAREYSPDLIGYFLMTYRYRDHYDLIASLRRELPNTPIVVGGPHVSTMREEVLKACAVIDYGVVLEGEETLVELCSGRDPSNIKGLLWRSGSEVQYNGNREPIEDLDHLSFPSFSAFEVNRYPYPGAPKEIVAMPIVTSRGCPSSCIYCPVQAAIGRRFRYRSPESIHREIIVRYEQGYRSIWIADDNFTLVRDRVVRLCELILASKLPGLRIGCGNGIRADRVDPELLALMKEAGFWYLAFGIESGSNRVLHALRKGYEIEAAEKGVRAACELGFEVVLFFLLGSPGETEEDFMQSLALAARYPVSDVRFYNLMPYPSTELFRWVADKGYFLRQPEEYLNDTISWQNHPVFDTPEMPVRVRMQLFIEGERARRRVRRARLEKRLNRLDIPKSLGRLVAALALVEFIEKQWRETALVNRIVMTFVRWRENRRRRMAT